MFNKSLKTIITSIFVMSLLSSGIVCSADETTAITTTVNTVNHVTTTAPMHSTVDNTSEDITNNVTTSSSLTDVTTIAETTTEEITTTTVLETTTETTTVTSPSPVNSTTLIYAPTNIIINDNILNKLSYENRIITIQSKVDDFLNSTSLTPNEALAVAKNYIRNISVLTDIEGEDILYLYRYATDIVKAQNQKIELNKNFYSNLENILNSVDYTNCNSIEDYCKHLINEGFKNGYLSSQETITLMNNIHEDITGRLTQWDLDLAEYYLYKFISDQSLVAKYSVGYPDMKGWIYIDGTPVDYPLMQYPYNNDYYLEHGWNGAEYSRGSIELDYRSSICEKIDAPETTENVLIYGHNLYDNAMFSSLVYYKDKSYWEEHQLIEISSDNEQRLYKIYAVCSIFGLADGTEFNYWNDKYVSMDEKIFNKHLELTKKTMLYDTQSFPQFGQDILTLQTCDGEDGWRVVVFAKRVK